MATKAREAFRTISEVANWLDIPAHVLRFWESKFTQIKPVKRAGGRRYYRPADMRLIGGIKVLLHDDGLTIRGVQKMLKEDGIKKISDLSPPLDMPSEEEGAARRQARRARRKARQDARDTATPAETVSDTSVSGTSASDGSTTTGGSTAEGGDNAPEAPFVHVEDDEAQTDNVVSLRSSGSAAEPEALEEDEAPLETVSEPEDVSEQEPATPSEEDIISNLANDISADDTAAQMEPPSAPAPSTPEPVVAEDPPHDSGSANADQATAVHVVRGLRGLDISTRLADGSADTVDGLRERLTALRTKMGTAPSKR